MKRFLLPIPYLLTVLCGACALLHPSPDRSRYFTLTSMAKLDSDDPGPRRDLALGLGPIALPAYLDRPEVVSRVGSNELHAATFDFWAGSLNDQFKSALSQNLARMIDRCRVTSYPWYAGTSFDATIRIDVVAFEVGTDRTAHLVARWVVRHGSSTDVSDVRESNLSIPVAGDDASDKVAALSEALTEFSGELATAVRVATTRTAAAER